MDDFSLALADICRAYPALMPPNHVRVSEGASEILRVARPGSSAMFWSAEETPYMVEPTDMLSSRVHAAVCFVGPAQSGKTLALGEAWMAHNVINDPGDMLIVQMSQDKAREYSKQRIDRAIRNSPKLAAMMGRSQDDNTHDKLFRNGMWVRIAWPTVSNLSSTSYRYVFLTDYDRMNDDIDGEGDAFTLGGKRTTTFLSRGMLAVESSPGRAIKDPRYRPATAHEAPPVGGILGIYNRSDRRRQYWKCPHCGAWMQATPGLGLFNLPSDDELLLEIRKLDIAKFAKHYARVVCPNSGCIVNFAERHKMNLGGRWLADGLHLTEYDRVEGEARQSSIAGYWLGGVAASFISWETLIVKHLQALMEFAMTGEETALQTTANTDQSMPYLSRHLVSSADDSPLAERIDPALRRYVVPDETRCVLASVDVQGGKRARFVVQVHAIGPYGEQWLVDRYDITHSQREGMGDQFAPIDPTSHPEDWDVLTEKVVMATYQTSDPEKEIRVYKTIVDTGGEHLKKDEGVTDKAYAWWRRLRLAGLSNRVVLAKGYSGRPDWFVRESLVGGKQGEGDVPLYLLNPNKLKDSVDAGLRRKTPGPGYYHWPQWVNEAFFDELEAETKDENGVWQQVKPRNESFDLCYYIRGLYVILGLDKIRNWAVVSPWLQPLETNSSVVSRDVRRAEKTEAPKVSKAFPRRTARSSYLS